MILHDAAGVLHASVLEGFGALWLWPPCTDLLIHRLYPVHRSHVVLVLWAGADAVVPRPRVRIRVGAPRGVVVGNSAPDIVRTFIVKLANAACCRQPFAS